MGFDYVQPKSSSLFLWTTRDNNQPPSTVLSFQKVGLALIRENPIWVNMI